MAALIALLLILAVFGGAGFAPWYVLVIAVVLWVVGFFVGPRVRSGRRWYW